MIRRRPGLPLGGPRQGQGAGAPVHPVKVLHRVAHGVDVRVGGAVVVIHLDPPAAQLQAGLGGKLCLRRHAHSQHHRLRREGERLLSPAQLYAVAVDGGEHTAQIEAHTVVDQLLVEDLNHIVVKGSHDLLRSLHQADLQPGAAEVLRHLDAHEAAAGHHDIPDLMKRHMILQSAHIPHVPHCEHMGGVRTPDAPGHHRPCAGGQHQLIVALLIFSSPRLTDENGLFLPQDLHGLAVDSDLNVMPLLERLGGHHHQRLAGGHGSAQIIR